MKRSRLRISLALVPVLSVLLAAQSVSQPDDEKAGPGRFAVTAPPFVIAGIPFTLEITATDAAGIVDTSYDGTPVVEHVYLATDSGPGPLSLEASGGTGRTTEAVIPDAGEVTVSVSDGVITGSHTVRVIPGVLSILPPLLAILLALTLRQVVLSLFAGIWLGAALIHGYDPLAGLLRLIDHFVLNAITDPDHAAIIIFTLFFGGMVGVISRNGGTLGIAELILRFSKNPRMGQLGTWLLGVVIFFDDYANCLIVGNTMRPITDKLRISREKLAYLVDSTAASVSSVFFVSTWIGYEVGLIDSGLEAIEYHASNAYLIFIESIPYCFYPILTLVMGFSVAVMGRDWGPMRKAEQRAAASGRVFREGAQPISDTEETGAISVDSSVPRRWYNGLVPIITVLVTGLISLYVTGSDNLAGEGNPDRSLSAIIGASDSFKALLWSSFAGCVTAILLTLGQGILRLEATMRAWVNGLKSMVMALLILVMAWAISDVTKELHTAEYVAQLLKGNMSVRLLPTLTFLISAAVSFSTGTSWGTMGIVMPIVIPLAAVLSGASGFGQDDTHLMLLGTISSVLAGAVFGDHCSPISDTTILSSMASSCDHIDHVNTQLPYAVMVAGTGLLVGELPVAFGFSPYLSILIGGAIIVAVIRFVGKPPVKT